MLFSEECRLYRATLELNSGRWRDPLHKMLSSRILLRPQYRMARLYQNEAAGAAAGVGERSRNYQQRDGCFGLPACEFADV